MGKEIVVEGQRFKLREIKQLYPAGVVKVGQGEETTEMSLEWIDMESKGRVEVTAYGLFISLSDQTKHRFICETREALDQLIADVARQIQ